MCIMIHVKNLVCVHCLIVGHHFPHHRPGHYLPQVCQVREPVYDFGKCDTRGSSSEYTEVSHIVHTKTKFVFS
jgi:hypothetical protein